jgi:hypothetical protein
MVATVREMMAFILESVKQMSEEQKAEVRKSIEQSLLGPRPGERIN